MASPEPERAAGGESLGAVNGFGKKLNGRATWTLGDRERDRSASPSNCSNDTLNHQNFYATNSDPWNRPVIERAFGIYEDEVNSPQSQAYPRVAAGADDPKTARYPRISKPMELMRHQYDCIVIGSGYGGGVAASRMARAGQSVCLLERGRERWPGEYPDGTADSIEQVHYSGEFVPSWLPNKLVNGGDPTGMYHLIFGNGQNAVVCNGKLFPAAHILIEDIRQDTKL